MASVEANSLVFARKSNPRGVLDEELNKLIEENQIHRCLGWKCNKKKSGAFVDHCINGYPYEKCDKDYYKHPRSTVYYARGSEDVNIVPYNPEFLKLMKCSTNVQIVNSENIAVYMSKYITVTRKDYIKRKCNEDAIEKGSINPVETFLKERRISIIEACMEILQCPSYCIYPKVYNMKIRLPNERLLRLMPFNKIRHLLEENNETQETEDTSESEDGEGDKEDRLESIFAPSIWENYMARHFELEDVTFIQMIANYKWCGNQDQIPQRCYKTDERLYYEQWSFLQLESYRSMEDEKNRGIEESNEIKEMKKHHSKICLEDTYQLAKYCYKQKNPKILNTMRRNYRKKDELFWFEILINNVPFRSFWELLIYDGRAYDSFKDVCEARGFLKLVINFNDENSVLNNIENLDRKLDEFIDGKIMVSISEFKQTIVNICKTIECTKENELITSKFRDCGIKYAKRFECLYREIKRKELLLDSKDIIRIYRRELSAEVALKTQYYKEFCYKSCRDILMDSENDMCIKIFKSFKRFEPEAVLKLNEELNSFCDNYNSEGSFSRSQKRTIDYLLKNIFSSTKICFYITGNAGTGKSFLLRQLVRLFDEVLNLNILVCASTGTAAKNINCTTVHKAFLINPNNVASVCLPGSIAFQSLKKKDVIIIDEISMLSEDIIQNIDYTLRSTQMYKGRDLGKCTIPFGGKLVIMFGDLLQIPCVGEQKIGESIRKVNPIYKSDSFKNFEWIFLYDQMRQANDDEYGDVCNELSRGLQTEATREWLMRRVCKDGEISNIKSKNETLKSYRHDTTVGSIQDCEIASDRDILVVAANNFIRNKHNKAKLESLFSEDKIKTFKAQYYIRGQKSTGDSLREFPKHFFYDDHTYEEVINLAVGCKAICNLNISIKDGLTNGTIGKIVAIHDDILEFEYYFNGKKRIAYITRYFIDCTIPTMDVCRGQFPVNLAYCLTMHKCQGQTLEGVVIDCEGIFAPGLFYSILARCKSADNIHIKRLIPSEHIIFDEEVVELINMNEREFADYFVERNNALPDINACIESYLFVLRETRISWSVVKESLEAIVNDGEDMWRDLEEKEFDEGYDWLEKLLACLEEREHEMMRKYNENKNNIEVDWRDNSTIRIEDHITDLYRKMYLVEDEDLIEGTEDSAIIDTEEEIKEEAWTERIHDFNTDFSLPWIKWVPEMKGMDCFLLLFNYCVYIKLSNQEIFNIFEKETDIEDIIKQLNSSLIKLNEINRFNEYASSRVCVRMNEVLSPFMRVLKDDDYIEDVLKYFNEDEGVFSIKTKCYYDCRSNCMKEDYDNMNMILKSSNYLTIECDQFRSSKKGTMHIRDNILFDAQYEVPNSNCHNCGDRIHTIKIENICLPKYLFIINKQENHGAQKYKELDIQQYIRVKKTLYLDKKQNLHEDLDTEDYSLQGVIQLNYIGNYYIHLKMEVDCREDWYEFVSSKQARGFIDPIQELDPTIIYRPSFENNIMWPLIFLYKRED